MNSNIRPDTMERITNFDLANKFIDEQVEEEESAQEIIDQLEAVEGNKYGLLMIDKDLATRTYTVPSPLNKGE